MSDEANNIPEMDISSPRNNNNNFVQEEQESPTKLVRPQEDDTNRVLDQSYVGLKEEGSEQKLLSSPKRQRKKNNARVVLPKLKTEENEEQVLGSSVSPQKNNESDTNGSPPRLRRTRRIPPGYQMANFDEAIKYWNSMAYNKKKIGDDGEPEY